MLFNRLLLVIGLILVVLLGLNPVAKAQNRIVASINGENISLASLSKGKELEIYQAEKSLYELRMTNLRKLLISKMIRLDPKSQGLNEKAYIDQYITKPTPVSTAQIDSFIVQRRIPQDKINANLKGQVKRYLVNQQLALQLDDWFKQQSNKHDVKISLVQPLEPRFEVDITNAPYRGGKNAKVTIVEFSDFQCPYCTKANKTLNELRGIYGDKIKIVYKHFPLSSIHPAAAKAAEASICAQQQGMDKFWLLHDELFANPGGLTVGVLKDKAKKLGLDSTRFNQCLSSGKYASRVVSEQNEGIKLGVSSTPAFFINGRFVKGALPIDTFKTIIDEELNNKR